ncbi:hypothetical protein [Chitinophaga sp. 212800010-3]
MSKFILPVILLCTIILSSCRTQKKGCPLPRRNWGAEKVIDELNKPRKR